ncbi:xyloglucan galactosyltransferase KATAMARI1 homolog [Lolium perenne]|uniref:xyloglucan galactosyltransferase KATAMARI1 homolog n=1 Tax=Lolium perenne TaxID=4522 RepID=UPI0021EA053B|nr:xyloglucan galactosyltransferase KATAMARI1 homolog [Lolium perenne]
MKRLSVMAERDGADGKQSAERSAVARPSRVVYVVFLATMFWGVIFLLHDHHDCTSSDNAAFFSQIKKLGQLGLPADKCAGRYVYMYDLPPRFNADLVRGCREVMCKQMANGGFGAPITEAEGGGALPGRGAYDTDQFMLALIFHARMKRHECLTSDPAAAAAVFVPFYSGLDVERFLYLDQENPDVAAMDALPRDLVEWLLARPEWRVMGGRDHFMVAGRIIWDFLREPGFTGRGGNSLLTFPAIRNLTVLGAEASPWHGIDFGVPYPSHFHFSSDADVAGWQGRMRRAERKWLWGFAGASRPSSKKTVRSQIIEQCGRSSRCAMFGRTTTAYTPGRTMKLLESAEFCVQPRGDSFTRKSTFDSILAGCIPVFFHPVSAYLQYIWHLPRDYRSYSVLINHGDVENKNASIEDVLARIPPAKVAQMREQVIRLIPTVMYRDPAAKGVTLKDAFDIAVDAVIRRVDKRRQAAAEGREYQDSFDGGNSWKHDLQENGDKDIGPHEFDPYF